MRQDTASSICKARRAATAPMDCVWSSCWLLLFWLLFWLPLQLKLLAAHCARRHVDDAIMLPCMLNGAVCVHLQG